MPLNKINLFTSYRSVLKKNYMLVYLIYFSFFLINGPLEKILPLLFQDAGFSEKVFGVFLSAISIIHIALPGGVAYLAQKYNPYKISIFAMFLSFAGAFFAGFFVNRYFFIIPFALLLLCGRTIFNFSLGNAINYELPEDNRGKYFAVRDLFLFGSISIGLFLGGLFTARFSIHTLFMLFSIGFLIPLVLIALANKKVNLSETGDSDSQGNEQNQIGEKPIASKKELMSEIFSDKKVWAYIFIQFGTIIYASAMSFLPLLGTSLGISVSSVMTMFGAVTIVNSVIALILGHFSDLAGRKWLVVFDLAFDILPALVFAFTQNVTLFIVGILLTMVKDALAPTTFAYFFDCFPEDRGVLVMGTLSSIGNALSFIAPILVGFLWATSAKYVFLIGAVGNTIAAVVAATMLPDIKRYKDKQIGELNEIVS